jgi:hypothetical protein
MIHGDCSSAGCYAMTDEQIGEIYSLAREAFLGGQKSFQIQAYPFRMTAANLARHRTNPNMPFWKMIKEGNDHFEATHLEPKVDVCEKHYVFDAQPPGNSTKPLAFSPSGRCPAFEVPEEIAGPAIEKQRNDEYQLAQLTKSNSPVAPVTLGTDGGMNRVFVTKLDTTEPFYGSDGHLHAPPVHPGMPQPTLSGPRQTADNDSGNSGRGILAMFSKSNSTPQAQPAAPQASTQVASADDHSGFFSWFKPKPEAAPQPADTPGVALAGIKPNAAPRKADSAKTDIAKTDTAKPDTAKPDQQKTAAPQVASTLKLKPTVATATQSNKPQQEANAAPATTGSVMKGAQPMVPSGSFDSRWAGLQ